MKKCIKIIGMIALILVLVSCKYVKEEYTYYYDGKAYTSDCEYGSLRSYWSIISYEDKEWEDIIVTAEWGEEAGQKLKGDANADIICIHDLLCVRKDIDLPTIEKNREDITCIELIAGDKSIEVTDKDKIDRLVEIMIEAANKTQETKDHNYEYVGNVDVNFSNLPINFFAGRIMEDKNGNLFFSSSVNTNIDTNKLFKSWYTVPLEIDNL